MDVCFVAPGSLDTVTGGYLYDRRLIAALRRDHTVDVVEVPPRPSGAIRAPPTRDYDVVVQDELCRAALAVPNLVARAPVVSVVHLLASKDPTCDVPEAAVERAYLRTVDGCIYTSDATRQASPARVPSVVARPASRFSPDLPYDEVRDRMRDGELHVVFVGNITPIKRLGTVVRAVARVPNTRLTVAGRADDAYADELRAMAERLGVADRVEFVGLLGDDALRTVLRDAHVVAVPSEYEAFGTAYVEGMSFGLPAVASSAGGASEVVEDGRNGFLVKSGDTDAVARHLRTLADDRELLASMAVEALLTSEAHVSWDETVRKAVRFVERTAGYDG